MPEIIDARVLYVPPKPELRFLPEGPYPCGPGKLSWIAIQHGSRAGVGSLNVLDLVGGENRTFPLPGRPGFAFACDRRETFVVGLERHLGLYDAAADRFTPLSEEVDADVVGTIINDGVCFAGGVVFGTKDLTFSQRKAGLYLWRSRDRRLIPLRRDQICSNGKVLTPAGAGGNRWTLLDIDSPTKTVVRYELDVELGTLSEAEMVIDLRAGGVFPDGMIATPDGDSVIISMYNPQDAEFGETRQYRLADGTLETVWRTPGSPQNTCPQLVEVAGSVKLAITTAVEHMPPERQVRHAHAGCLFLAETPFTSLPPTPVFAVD